jgi:hypothetical protein
MAPPFQDLPRSYKKRYPFRIGTTSFIYPAGYTENVARLGPHVDEIEILMFESHPDSRPTDSWCGILRRRPRRCRSPIIFTCPPTSI